MLSFVLSFSMLATPDGWFGADKVKHFVLSSFIQTVSYSSLQAAGVEHRAAMISSIGMTTVVGVGREIHDGRVKGRFSGRDLVWDGLGIAAGAAVCNNVSR